MSSSLIVPFLRMFCDDATKLIKSTIGDSLYTGGVEKVGMERYLERAHKLGKKLAA